jgi:hypothetical protein
MTISRTVTRNAERKGVLHIIQFYWSYNKRVAFQCVNRLPLFMQHDDPPETIVCVWHVTFIK